MWGVEEREIGTSVGGKQKEGGSWAGWINRERKEDYRVSTLNKRNCLRAETEIHLSFSKITFFLLFSVKKQEIKINREKITPTASIKMKNLIIKS